MKRMQSKHKRVVSKKIAAIAAIIILLPITVAYLHFYWQSLPPTHSENATYIYQPYVPTQGQRVVSIVFDDGWQSQFDNAVSVLNQYGFKATFGIITGYADGRRSPSASWPAYMNWDEIVELAKNGQDIVSHTYDHQNLATLNNVTIDYELSKSKQDLNSHGINAPVFIYPFGAGAGNTTVESFVQKYYLITRDISDGTVNITQPFNRFELPAYLIHNTTTLTQFTNIVNNADNSTIVIIFYHKISSEDIDTATSPQAFAAQMKYLSDNNYTVMTLRDLFLKRVR